MFLAGFRYKCGYIINKIKKIHGQAKSMTDRLICFQDWFDFVIYQNSSGEPKSVMEWVYNIQQTKKSVKKYVHVAKGTLENIQYVVSNKFWHKNKMINIWSRLNRH